MAHVLKIPMAFEYRPYPCLWSVEHGEITGWVFDKKFAGFDDVDGVWLTAPGLEERLSVFVGDLGFPAEIQEKIERAGRRPDLATICRGCSVEILVRDDTQHRKMRAGRRLGKVQDAWEMRREFFRLKQDTHELLEFLNKWGEWDIEGANRFSSTIWRERDLLRKSLLGAPWFGNPRSGLFGSARSGLPFGEPLSKYPYYLLQPKCCEDALRTTVSLDLLQRVKFSVCARRDCRAPFAIESQHKRKFCCQYCAHLESVRKQRRETTKTRKGR
jgi:hypothetical protein